MSLNVLSDQSSQNEDAQPAVLGSEGTEANSELPSAEDIDSDPAFPGIVGQSAALRGVLQLVEMVAASDAIVLL